MKGETRGFIWYLAGVMCAFLPFGIHNVLYAWLVAVYLGESGIWLGVAQMAAQLPALFFVLFGGLLADRVDRRRILITAHLIAALPAIALALSIEAGHFSYGLLITFALAFSTLNSFIQPARDSLLNQVSGSNLQRSVTLVMGLTFFSQILGYGMAAQADLLGPIPLLIMQGLVLGFGGILSFKLPRSTPQSLYGRSARRSALSDIGEGLRVVFSSSRMAPVMVLMFAVGMFYSGAFMVVNPLVVRDVYGGGASDIAMSYIAFMSGTIITTAILISIGGINRSGLGLMLALLAGTCCLLTTLLRLPFAGYLVCLGGWGICAGVTISLARSIIQENAPENIRARAMSVFTLGMLGGTPIGSPLMGYVCTVSGPLSGYAVAVTGILITVSLVWFYSNLVNVHRMEVQGA